MQSKPLVPGAGTQGPATLDDPFYYLNNFLWLLSWVASRYGDLLTADEQAFINQFNELPTVSQGLFVRMVMRSGELFRSDKLRYAELGAAERAVEPLLDLGWVEVGPELEVDELFRLFTWPELNQMLGEELRERGLSRARKRDVLGAYIELGAEPRTPKQWGAHHTAVYRFTKMPLCDRLRIMFFGNAYQDWSEFVLTELGTYQYETVAFTEQSRPFHSRAEVDTYLQLQMCRERLANDEPLAEILAWLPSLPSDNPWLRRNHDKLLFKVGRQCERAGELDQAEALYRRSSYPGARARHLRVLELKKQYAEALNLAEHALENPENEAERQLLERCLPRIRRHLGLPRLPKRAAPQTEELNIELEPAASVELAVRTYLETSDAPVFYLENSLFNSLFGLLCWDALFAPLPGAFFHPFQRSPADLYWSDFYQRRKELFDRQLASLESETHRQIILENFHAKQGLQSAFVYWGALSSELIELALLCIPAKHLQSIFIRMLADLKANCAGFPDLVQFWPRQCRYRLVEVKGPGDKLQDNQRRWLEVFDQAQIPSVVCYVQWASSDTTRVGGVNSF